MGKTHRNRILNTNQRADERVSEGCRVEGGGGVMVLAPGQLVRIGRWGIALAGGGGW